MKLFLCRVPAILGLALLIGTVTPGVSRATDPEFHEKAQHSANAKIEPAAQPEARAQLKAGAAIEVVAKPGITVFNTSQLTAQKIEDAPQQKVKVLGGKDAIGVSENTSTKIAY